MHIKVKVYPESGEENIVEVDKGKYEIYIREPAKGGLANKGVLRVLQEKFKNREVKIVSGHLSRNKIIEIVEH